MEQLANFGNWLSALFFGIEYQDIGTPVALLLWLIVIYLALRSIDHSTIFVGFMYILYSNFVGVALSMAVPSRYDALSSARTMAGLFVMFSLVAAGLYFVRYFRERASLH